MNNNKCSKCGKSIKRPFFYIFYDKSLFLMHKSKLVCKECYWKGEPQRIQDRYLNIGKPTSEL